MADDTEPDLADRLRGLEGGSETAELLRTEARKTIDHQIDALDDIDEKAARILRVNVLLVGVVLSVLSLGAQSQAVEVDDFLNRFVGIGVGSLLLSSALAAWTYTASDFQAGISPDDVATLFENDVTREQSEMVVAKSYALWIEYNEETNLLNTPLITATTVVLVVSIAHFALGVYHALIADVGWKLVGATWFSLGTLAYLSELPRQITDALAVSPTASKITATSRRVRSAISRVVERARGRDDE